MGLLLKELKNTPTNCGGKKSKLHIILDQLDQTDRKDLIDALNDKSITANTIVKVLSNRGFTVSRTNVSKYRNPSS